MCDRVRACLRSKRLKLGKVSENNVPGYVCCLWGEEDSATCAPVEFNADRVHDDAFNLHAAQWV